MFAPYFTINQSSIISITYNFDSPSHVNKSHIHFVPIYSENEQYGCKVYSPCITDILRFLTKLQIIPNDVHT